ncbi:NAD(P)/FAD-dependent oxidoreductase [Undibacterium sp.]|uniref:NAD(P)/FAD-dependent oxidoreductase n=1 Tax=Undibacterium sp. TaxID=1914977 RepID=UPI00272F9554|nr:FAD-dependent oxidoreductase [Undibacterium sp.]MDP1977549.1 FAD-dependent oxidoreductase [Undibacterium sp.]
MKPIAIIGSGLAGYTVAREFRKLDKTTPLLIVTGDDGGFYSKPMLSNAFAMGKQPQQLKSKTVDQMAAELNANILTGTVVSSINTQAQTIQTKMGDFEYSQLVLALGAQAIRLLIDGNAADQVLFVNNLADYAVFRNKLALAGDKARVTILGAGLIGCEFSDDLASAGHEVILIDPNPLPLAALAPAAISSGLHAALESKGVKSKLGTTATQIAKQGNALQVRLSNDEVFDTDVVLSAVGLRADIRLAQAAQLQTDRGIIIDEHGQTSVPGIFSLGDCAQYKQADGSHSLMPYVAPIMTAARAIAQSLTGKLTSIDMKPTAVLVKTPSYPVALIPPALAVSKSGSWESVCTEGVTTSRYFDENKKMHGFALAPQDAKSRNALIAELSEAQVARPI